MKTALMKATDLLARQEQSERLLKRKLSARKYSSAEIDDAIDKLKRHNYLDDEAACGRQFERLYSEGKLSLKQIYVKLIQRGFEAALIDKFVPSDSAAVNEREYSAALRSLRLKFKSRVANEKLYRHLSMKGFENDAIVRAVEEFNGVIFDE